MKSICSQSNEVGVYDINKICLGLMMNDIFYMIGLIICHMVMLCNVGVAL